jgi:hypothetical protein
MKRLLILFNIITFSVQSQQLIPLNEKPYLDSLQNILRSNETTKAAIPISFCRIITGIWIPF